jgi:RNA polymerase sigma-70 factor (sigma-E family)
LEGVNGDIVDARALIGQDPSARIAAVYGRHARQAGRLAYLLTGDADLAEDLTQEAFVNLMGRLGSIRDERAIAPYLRRSIVNLASKHWRKVGNERRTVNVERDSAAVRTASMPDIESQDQIWRTLEGLPYRQRAAIVLRFYEDLSERETARVLGCRVGTVKSAVSRGLERVRKEMTSDADERT